MILNLKGSSTRLSDRKRTHASYIVRWRGMCCAPSVNYPDRWLIGRGLASVPSWADPPMLVRLRSKYRGIYLWITAFHSSIIMILHVMAKWVFYNVNLSLCSGRLPPFEMFSQEIKNATFYMILHDRTVYEEEKAWVYGTSFDHVAFAKRKEEEMLLACWKSRKYWTKGERE